MKKILLPLVAALALFAGRTQADTAAVPLVNLVGDDTSLVIYVTNMPALVKTWQGTPWMKMWNDDQVQKYFAKSINYAESRQEFPIANSSQY